MKERKFLTSALFIAAAAMSFGVVSAQATDHELVDGRRVTGGNSDNFNDDSFIISSGTIDSSNWGTTDHLGAWIVWAGVASNNNGGSLGTTTITGNGFLGLAVRYGGSDYHADLTNVDASGFTGQFTVVNTYAKLTEVQLKGDGWAGVEYVFGGVTTEWANASGSSSDSVPYYRGITGTGSTDTLALQGDTTLAGVTGTSKGFTVSGYDVNSMEFITAAAKDIVLTIAGTGEYEFYGTVGAEELELSISMGYASDSGKSSGEVGSQTFGGTNYLDNVTVNEGTLKLGGTTSISGDASVASGAELDLSGTVTLGSAISNSGTVVVDSDVVFVLDKLTSSDGTYTIITNTNGGSITGWESLDYSNFSGVTSDRQITSSSNGSITIDTNESAHDLTWSGSSGGTWNSNVDTNTVWTNSDNSTDYFVNGDNVTFNSYGSTEITISGAVHAAEMTVSDGSYTFSASADNTLTVDSVSVNSSDALTFTGGGEFSITGNYSVLSEGNETYGASLTVGENTSVTMANYEANWHQGATTLGEGATLTVTTQMWFHTNETEVLTGGTFNLQQLTISNAATVVSIYDTNLNIGAGDTNGGLKNDTTQGGYFLFGDNLTVGVWEGTDGTNKSWSSSSAIVFSKEGTGTTFSTESGQNITLSGSLSGSSFSNTGSGTLTLSGTVALSGAIINSGNIVLDAGSVSFAVDALTVNAYTDGKTSYYEIITGADSGSVTFDGGSYSNFTLGGEILSSSWNIYTDNGYLVIYRSAKDLIWAGTGDSNEWNYADANWNDGSTTTFAEGDNVTFGAIESGSPYGTVNITTSITAGTIAVNDDYKFVFTDGIKVEAQYVDVATNKTLKLELASGASSAEFHMDGESFVDFFGGSENHGTVEIGSGVTFYLSDLNNSYTFNSNNTTGSVTGTGTLSIGTTGSNHELGLYLPEFQGTVIFREGTSAVRFGYSNDYDTGVFNSNATLVFESGVGLTLVGNTTSAVSAALVFEDGSHTIATNGDTAEFSGAIDAADATITISGTGKLTFSGSVNIDTLTISSASTDTFSGGGSIGTLQLGGAATIVLSGEGKTYTITEIAATAHANSTLEISEGTTVNAENLTANWHFETMQVDGVLNISGTAVFGTASVDTYVEHFTGSGIVTIGTLQIGHSSNNNGASIKIEGGITFIVGEVTSGYGTNHYVEIANATIGTTSETLTFGADENKFVLSAEEGSATIFNTSKFDTTTNEFTDQAATITIAANITGDGAMKVTGNGKLILSGTSYLSSVTVDSGATLEIGGTLALSSAIENSGTIVINDGTTFALDNLEEGYHADGIGYYEIITNTETGMVSFNTNSGVYNFTNGDTTLSGWTIVQGSDGNIWIYGPVGSFNWAGDSESHNWSTSTDDKTWLIGDDMGKSAFVNGSDATFGQITDGKPYYEVNITESLKAGSITVEDNYTFTTTNSEGVVVDAGGDLKVAEGATLTIDSNVTIYIDEVEDNFSVEGKIAGTGTIEIDLTGGSSSAYASTINLGDGNEFAGTVYIHAGDFTLNDSNIGNGTYELADGVGMQVSANTTITVENDFIIDGATDLHCNTNGGASSLTLTGSLTGNGTLTLAAGSENALTITGAVDLGGFTLSGGSAVFEDSTTSVRLGSLTIASSGTVTFNKDATITGNVAFTTARGETLAIGDGATLKVGGNLTDTDANNAQNVHITLGTSSTLNVDGTMTFTPGGAGSYCSTISGEDADNSTATAGSVQLGDTTTGGALEISDMTFITGGISFGNANNGSNYNLFLSDATLGFTNDVTIAATTGASDTSRFVLGSFAGNSTDTGSGTTTTINTSRYDTTANDFTSTGVNVTISQEISGHGALVVEGTGKLILQAANTFDGGLTITSGTVVSQNASSLGGSDVTVSGGNLQVDVTTTVTGYIAFSETGKLIVGQTLLATVGDSLSEGETAAVAVITANTITFGTETLSTEGNVTDSVAEWAAAQSGQYTITGWYYYNSTLYAIVALPEPSMFGLLFGLGAAALTATRRRRREAA